MLKIKIKLHPWAVCRDFAERLERGPTYFKLEDMPRLQGATPQSKRKPRKRLKAKHNKLLKMAGGVVGEWILI